jgi:hypothetical protein
MYMSKATTKKRKKTKRANAKATASAKPARKESEECRVVECGAPNVFMVYVDRPSGPPGIVYPDKLLPLFCD